MPTPVQASRARWVGVRIHVILLGIVGYVNYFKNNFLNVIIIFVIIFCSFSYNFYVIFCYHIWYKFSTN
jgi:hypothetical protein